MLCSLLSVCLFWSFASEMSPHPHLTLSVKILTVASSLKIHWFAPPLSSPGTSCSHCHDPKFTCERVLVQSLLVPLHLLTNMKCACSRCLMIIELNCWENVGSRWGLSLDSDSDIGLCSWIWLVFPWHLLCTWPTIYFLCTKTQVVRSFWKYQKKWALRMQ